MHSTDRKKQLIAQGAVHRAEILLAKQAARASLRPDALAHGALTHAAGIGLALFGKRGGKGAADMGVQALLPVLLSAVSALAKRKSLRNPVAGALLAGAAAALAAYRATRKAASAAESDRAA